MPKLIHEAAALALSEAAQVAVVLLLLLLAGARG